jgi:hypothetical protein
MANPLVCFPCCIIDELGTKSIMEPPLMLTTPTLVFPDPEGPITLFEWH